MLLKSCKKSSPRSTLASLALALALGMLLVPAPALAYLDPGTGSFLIQGIIAAVVGAGFAVKMFWSRIKAFLTGKKAAEDDDSDE
jgi:nitrate/nitrite transporter NarK